MSSALSELAHHRKRKGGHMDGSISSLHLWSISLLCGLRRPPAPLCLPWDRPRIDRVAFGASLTGLGSRSDNIFCVVISQPRTQIQTSDEGPGRTCSAKGNYCAEEAGPLGQGQPSALVCIEFQTRGLRLPFGILSG